MGCNGCTSSANGKPSGCKSNGSCSSGGCNRLNVFDWLSDISVGFSENASRFVEVSFKNGARKEFFRNKNNILIDTHDVVAVESESGGFDIGVVSMTGELVRLQMKRKKVQENSTEIRGVIRKATEQDHGKWDEARKQEAETMKRARAIARQMGLEMKIGDVEFQGDGKKATFYYTAEDRVDFRELIKVYARDFRVKIDMYQIGARQEAARIGGIGSCGRELCCSTWLTEFKTVATSAARYQNLSINQAKLSGQCGRLKCCLNYELDTYLDALTSIPKDVERIETESGTAFLQKTDIFKKLMFFTYKDSSVFHPLTAERVIEIVAMNKEGKKPTDLGSIQAILVPKKEKENLDFADVVGQTTLESLKGNNKKKKNKGKNRNNRPERGEGGGGDRGDRSNQPRGNAEGGKPAQQNAPRPQRQNSPKPAESNAPKQGGGQNNPRPPKGNDKPKGNNPQKNQNQNPRPPKKNDKADFSFKNEGKK